MLPPSHSAEKRTWHFVLLIAIPALLLWGIFSFSPNFKFADMANPKSIPLGGDYLQEYTGGWMIAAAPPNRRTSPYDLEVFKQQQHDSEMTGFTWDQSQFFPPVYPPFWYAAVSPLSRLDYHQAIYVWAALMTACLIVALLLIYKFTGVPVFLLLILCLSTPVIHSISSGQKGTLLLLTFTVSFVLLKKLQPAKSGVVFALSVFKPYLGVCVGVWMMLRGEWRWVTATLLTVAAIIAASFMTMPDLCKDYVGVCLGFGDYVKSGGYDLAKSYSLWSGWQMLISHSPTAKLLTGLTTIEVLGGALVFLRRLSHEKDDSLDVAFAVMMLVTAITAPHFYYYDLTLLILPAAIFASRATQHNQTQFSRVQWMPVILIAAAMFGSPLLERVGLTTSVALGPLLLIAAGVYAIRNTNEPAGEVEAPPET